MKQGVANCDDSDAIRHCSVCCHLGSALSSQDYNAHLTASAVLKYLSISHSVFHWCYHHSCMSLQDIKPSHRQVLSRNYSYSLKRDFWVTSK